MLEGGGGLGLGWEIPGPPPYEILTEVHVAALYTHVQVYCIQENCNTSL